MAAASRFGGLCLYVVCAASSALFPAAGAAQTPESIVRTVVGGGPVDAPGLQTVLSQITAVSVGPDGSTYLALRGHAAVYRVSPTGLVTVVAGTGFPGYSGDGGPATAAKLEIPTGVAADSAGSVYISDWISRRVRRVAPDGTISTFAGGGATFGEGVPATEVALSLPRGIAVDLVGRVVFVDAGSAQVRRVDSSGTIATVAGDGSTSSHGDGGPATAAGLNVPTSVAFDGAGNMFITESQGHRVRMVAPNGTISTFAGSGVIGSDGDGGQASLAQLNAPYGVSVDAAGNVFIAELNGQRVRRVSTTGVISTVAGTGVAGYGGDGGPATAALLMNPMGVAIDAAGDLLIADSDNLRLRRVQSDGTIQTIVGDGRNEGAWNAGLGGFSGDGGRATTAQLWSPRGIASDSAGNLYIADELNHRVRKVTPNGTISTLAGTGSRGFSGDGGIATSAQLNGPTGVAADAVGNVYIADDGNARVRVVTPDGRIATFAGRGCCGYEGDGGPATEALLYRPRHLAVDVSGNVYIADSGLTNVRKVTPSGIISTFAVGVGLPAGVAVDATGNVLVMDGYNHQIWSVSPTGDVSPIVAPGPGYAGDGGPAGSAQTYLPTAAIPDRHGNLFIADGGNNRIRKIAPDGIITTIAGYGGFGLGGGLFEGDGGPAVDARFNNPMGLAFLPDGRLLVADLSNNRIRAIDPGGRSPVVDAGPDQLVEATGATTPVSLSGTASDPDGETMTYAWADVAGTVLATSLSPSVQLPIGRHELRLRVTKASGLTAEDLVVITVEDTLGPAITISSPAARTYGLFEAVTADFRCVDAASEVATCEGTVLNASRVETATAGTKDFVVQATDTAGNTSSSTVRYTVARGVPVIDWTPPSPIVVGTALSATQLNAVASVPGTFAYVPPAGTVLGEGTHQLSTTFTPADTLNYDAVTATVPLTIVAGASEVTFQGPTGPIRVRRTVALTAFFSAPPLSGLTCTFTWRAASTTTVPVSGSGSAASCSSSTTYAAAGIYEVAVAVVGSGFSATGTYQSVVVYDPNAGSVAGAGWIASPRGSLRADPVAESEAWFVVGARYQSSRPTPAGSTVFYLRLGSFTFLSESLDWLVVSGPTAFYQGVGRVNGSPGYRFQVTAVDGHRPGSDGIDRLRIRIVNAVTGEVVYDNAVDGSDVPLALPPAIAGGLIAFTR